MSDLKQFMESGILEMYVLGRVSAAEQSEVLTMAQKYTAVKEELDLIERTLEDYAFQRAEPPGPADKLLVAALIAYREKYRNDPLPVQPPLLSQQSAPADFIPWLTNSPSRTEMEVIGHTADLTTAIVRLSGTPTGLMFTEEEERVLLLEGSCLVTLEGKAQLLRPGALLFIPARTSRMFSVLPGEPCSFILQQVIDPAGTVSSAGHAAEE